MKNKGERGAVTLFVVVICVFITIMLVTFTMRLENQKQIQNKEIEQITKSYQENEQDLEEIYYMIVNELNKCDLGKMHIK